MSEIIGAEEKSEILENPLDEMKRLLEKWCVFCRDHLKSTFEIECVNCPAAQVLVRLDSWVAVPKEEWEEKQNVENTESDNNKSREEII